MAQVTSSFTYQRHTPGSYVDCACRRWMHRNWWCGSQYHSCTTWDTVAPHQTVDSNL